MHPQSRRRHQWWSLERQGILCSPREQAQGHEVDFSGDHRVGISAKLLLCYCRKPAAAKRYLIRTCRLKPSRTIVPAVPAHAPTLIRLCSAVRTFFPGKFPRSLSPRILSSHRIFLEILPFPLSIFPLLCAIEYHSNNNASNSRQRFVYIAGDF